jgi:hypothetical protein
MNECLCAVKGSNKQIIADLQRSVIAASLCNRENRMRAPAVWPRNPHFLTGPVGSRTSV